MSESTPSPSSNPSTPDSSNAPMLRACRSPLAWAFFLIPAALGVTADLAFKAWSFPTTVGGVLQGRAPFQIIPNVLNFVTTTNQGMVFGLAQGKVTLFAAFSWIALGIIVWVFAMREQRARARGVPA